MIKIRYHHLMCIPRYEGKGYSDDFCDNMNEVKLSLKENNYILTEECDDICRLCPNNKDGKCVDDEKVRRYDKEVKQRLLADEIIHPKDICSDCSWFEICKKS